MAYSTKTASFTLWLSLPLAILCSLLYTAVILFATERDALNLVTEDHPGVDVTAKTEIIYNETRKIAPGEHLHAICYKGAFVVVDLSNGDRITVEEDKLNGDLTDLPVFNSGFDYYIKGDKEGSTFIGRHIDDVINEVGSYLTCDKQAGRYFFDHVALVDGADKYLQLALIVNSNGVVTKATTYYDRWNIYGLLPFYESVVCMNIFNTRCSGIYRDEIGFLYGLLVFLFIMAAPAATYIYKKEEIGDTRALPSAFLSIYGLYSAVLEYILVISFVEFSHDWWLITLPLTLFVAFGFSIIRLVEMQNCIVVYCDKCGAKNSLYVTRKKLEERYHYEYTNYSSDDKKVSYKGYELNSGEEVWEGRRRQRTTRCKVTTVKYLEETRCKKCNYYSSREVTEEFRGPENTVSNTVEKTLWKEV